MKGIIITRVSTEEQSTEGHHSLPVQLERLRDYAKRKGVEIVEEFIVTESAFSGKRNKFTSALEKGIAIDPDGKFALFIQNPDRFTRQVNSAIMLKVEELRTAGKIIIYVLSPEMEISKDTSATDLGTWNILIAVANMQSGITSDKIKASIKHKLSRGEYPGYVPTGYLNVQNDEGIKAIIIDKERAPLVKEAYKLYATDNYSIQELTKMMRAKGLTIKPKGKKPARPVTTSDILMILHSRTYTGSFEWDNTIYEGTNYDAILSQTLWDKVQNTLKSRAIKYSTKHTSTAKFFRYRGLLRCGYCGCTLTPMDMSSNYKNVKPGDPGSIYYRCTYMKKSADPDWYLKKFPGNHSGVSKRKQKIGKGEYSDKKVNTVNCPQLYWKEEEIDEHIKRKLKYLAFDKTVIQKIKAKIGVEYKERMSAAGLQMKGIEAELKQKEKLQTGLIDKTALAEDAGVAIEWQNRLKEVQAEMETLKAQLNTIDGLKENDTDEVIDALSLCADLYKQYDKLGSMGKRRVVMSAFQELTLKKGWFGKKKNPLREKLFYAKWTESFHELWEKWFKGYLKKERDDRERLGLDKIEEELDRLDDLEGKSDIDPRDATEEPENEDLTKSMDSM
jgi:DNA invertase Pin-like site-specific DNA recombinase